ncbi:MAG: fibronectin type III domain-containing protein, partial [Candidatus Krumholzibacteria bacterium]|nr:fibronectin type III domain-containing protein [Candidatus Krumholzibacteria bacterium]
MRPLSASPLRQILFSAPALALLIGFCALTLASCDLLFGPDVGGSSSAVDVPPPPPGTVHAVDISSGTGEITAEDIACWKREYGAEHMIVAFNWPESKLALALRQLEIVVASGVTVDAYVWIAWTETNRPLGPERVETVLSLVSDYPVRRLWLDVESHRSGSDSELDSAQRLPILRAAVAACGGFPCGIYTRKNLWNAEIGPTTEFNGLPLWYAHYDQQPNFQDWHNFPAENPDLGPFGGWSSPTGKQYDSDETVAADRAVLCTNPEIDWSVMKVPGANDEDPPPAPTGLRPNGVTVTESPVTVRWDAISDATEYQLEVEYRDGGSWTSYWTERRTTNSFEFPLGPETSYRFKVSAKNGYGWGPFSDWASFDFVKPGHRRR